MSSLTAEGKGKICFSICLCFFFCPQFCPDGLMNIVYFRMLSQMFWKLMGNVVHRYIIICVLQFLKMLFVLVRIKYNLFLEVFFKWMINVLKYKNMKNITSIWLAYIVYIWYIYRHIYYIYTLVSSAVYFPQHFFNFFHLISKNKKNSGSVNWRKCFWGVFCSGLYIPWYVRRLPSYLL